MVNDGKLPRIQGMWQIRIPVNGLEQWVTDNTVYNSSCAGSGMLNPTGERSCLSAKGKKASTNGLIVMSGGVPTQTQAVRGLDAVLKLATKETR